MKAKLTDLEKYIYKCAKPVIKEMNKTLRNTQFDSDFVAIPFLCDGVIDSIIYSVKKRECIKIEYSKGKGSGTNDGISKYASYFDSVTVKVIDLA